MRIRNVLLFVGVATMCATAPALRANDSAAPAAVSPTAAQAEKERQAAEVRARQIADEAVKAQDEANRKSIAQAKKERQAAEALAKQRAAETVKAQKQFEKEAATKLQHDRNQAEVEARKRAEETARAAGGGSHKATIGTGKPEEMLPGDKLGFARLEVPAMPLTPEKCAQLEEIFALYRTDKLTPQEYHQKRAEILAAK